MASTASWPMLARWSALRAGEGASSSTFWWRRCSEQGSGVRKGNRNFCPLATVPCTLSFTQFMRRVDEISGVLDRRLLKDAVAQVHDVTLSVACPVKDFLGPFPDEIA